MEIFEINGGAPLVGTAVVHGAKNSVLPILAAALLGDGCEIDNCPELTDVATALDILRCLGCKAELKNGVAFVTPGENDRISIPCELMGEMRSSVTFLGAILARSGEAEIYLPGGCRIGARPIDLHLDALAKLGAEIKQEGEKIVCIAPKLRGARIDFPMVSVGATENAIIAAALAEGDTIISNAAREPEIADLQNFLNKMGAHISGAGSSEIYIKGVERLHEARHRIIPDRIEAATVLCAAAACGGKAELGHCEPRDMAAVLEKLKEMGCILNIKGDSIYIERRDALKAALPVVTEAYPGFPTDAQPLLMAASLKAEGRSVYTETIFENRFAHVSELRRMGAEIAQSGRMAVVNGVKHLQAADVRAADLRGGAALMIAALSADGVSRVSGTEFINRGYEAPERVFAGLGAEIKRREVTDPERKKKQAQAE